MTTTTIGDERLDLGRVIGLTWEVFGRNWLALVGVYLVLILLVVLAFGAVVAARMSGAPGRAVAGLGFLLVGPLIVLTVSFFQVPFIKATLADMRGEKLSFGDLLRSVPKYALPVSVVSMLAGFGIVIGLALLFLPGLFLLTIWAVALPVVVVERRSAVNSLRRSAALTDGNRWVIFGLVAIVWLVSAVTALVPILNLLVSLVGGVLCSVGLAVIYAELRRIRDGALPEELASVFD